MPTTARQPFGDSVRVADVGRDGDALRELRNGLFEDVATPAEDGDFRAEPPELERHGAAEPAAAACYEHDAIGERSFGKHQPSSSL